MKSRSLLALVSSLIALPALAHDGHGLFGAHWHATDALGFVGVGLLVGLAVWLSKGGK
ncbi:MAG: hypothetical protein Q8K24_09805 [Hydrogenophaga sp.]|nr:hypothetical protein [Hydrogenophaga sp.]